MEGGIPPVSINTCFDLNQFIIIICGNLPLGGCLNECLTFFPTCQVRVVRFYVSCLLLLLLLVVVLLVLLVQLRPAIHSVLCRTSTTTIHAQCSPTSSTTICPVFPAGPQPRPSTPSVPCRTSTTTIHAQCSLPDLNHDHPRPVFPAGPHLQVSTPSVPCRTSTASIHAKRYAT